MSISLRGAKYCSLTNCSNNERTTIDSRTGQTVRLHRFPLLTLKDSISMSPEERARKQERLSQWIVNTGMTGISLKKIANKRVCSVHFEATAYNCPSDILNTYLVRDAVPTLHCTNPPAFPTPQRLTLKSTQPSSPHSVSNLSEEESPGEPGWESEKEPAWEPPEEPAWEPPEEPAWEPPEEPAWEPPEEPAWQPPKKTTWTHTEPEWNELAKLTIASLEAQLCNAKIKIRKYQLKLQRATRENKALQKKCEKSEHRELLMLRQLIKEREMTKK